MGDVDDRHSLRLQAADYVKQRGGLALGQGRGGLVHDDHARIQGQRLGDFDHLLARHTEILHLSAGVEIDAQSIEQRARLTVQPPPVDQSEPSRCTAQKDVFSNRKVGRQIQFLVNHGNPERHCLTWVFDACGCTVQSNGAGSASAVLLLLRAVSMDIPSRCPYAPCLDGEERTDD